MDDRTLRIICVAVIFGLLIAFQPQISRFMHRIGYRDWRKPK